MSEGEVELHEGPLPAPQLGGGLERRRGGGLDLSPEQLLIRRKNRRWMLTLVIPTIIVASIGTLITLKEAQSGPSVSPASVPAGYKSVVDGYFGYSVPAPWKTSNLFSDYAGDLYNGDASGFAAEHLGSRSTAPTPNDTRPAPLESFGMQKPTAYSLSAAQPTQVQGASVAYRYVMSRPGFEATLIDAWQSSTGADVWLEIHADPATTNLILSTLRT